MFGESFVSIVLKGDTFDDSYKAAMINCQAEQKTFVHPFDDEKVIEGQATVALEILSQSSETIDYIFVPVGGGGLASGVSSVIKLISPTTKVIGVEPEGAPSMQKLFCMENRWNCHRLKNLSMGPLFNELAIKHLQFVSNI